MKKVTERRQIRATKKQMELKKISNTIEFNDGTIEKASCVYKKNTKMLKIQDIDLNKIKTSKKKRYSKANKAYKHYVVYEYNDENIPLLIRFPEMIDHYKVFKDGRSMNFTCDDEELLEKY